jgi:tetratricopeptide (TPR) repeat protein
MRAEIESATCYLHAMCGRFDESREMGQLARQHLEEVGRAVTLANLAQSTAHCEELAKNFESADREYAASCEALDRLGETAYLSTVAGLRARMLARIGRFAEASQSRKLSARHAPADDLATHLLLAETDALLAAAESDTTTAVAASDRAVSMAREIAVENPQVAAEAYATTASVARSLDDLDLERAHLERAFELFETKGNVVRASAIREQLVEAAG